MFAYIKESENIITEFTYVGRDGVTIEGRNNTSHIVQSITLDESIKNEVINELPFGDEMMYSTNMFDNDISYIYFSLFNDPNLGLYKNKKNGAIVAFGEWTNDLTDENLWDKFINKELFVATCNFTKEKLQYIKDNYDFLGRLSVEQITENLKFIFNHINKEAILILNLGSEIPYLKNKQTAYNDRHIYNKKLNEIIKSWAEKEERIKIIDVNKYITGQESFNGNINHFVKIVYFKLSRALIEIINSDGQNDFQELTKLQERINFIKTKISRIPNKIKRLIFKK